MKENQNPWQTKSEKLVYETPWIKIEEHEAVNPAGQDCLYGVVRFQNIAVGILPLTDDKYTYLVGQHRYPFGTYSWEIPEGGCPKGEDALDAAKRELKEETGLTAEEYIPFLDLQLSNSVSDEVGIVYLAKGLKEGESEPEPSEDITVKKLHFDEVYEMVMKGEIVDSITISAILKAKVLLDRGEL